MSCQILRVLSLHCLLSWFMIRPEERTSWRVLYEYGNLQFKKLAGIESFLQLCRSFAEKAPLKVCIYIAGLFICPWPASSWQNGLCQYIASVPGS